MTINYKWVPFVATMLTILALATVAGWPPAEGVDEELFRANIARGDNDLRETLGICVRKIGHVFAFVLLALTTFPASSRKTALLLCMAVACGTEALQFILAGRTATFLDCLLNVMASLLGLRLLINGPRALRRLQAVAGAVLKRKAAVLPRLQPTFRPRHWRA